MYPRHQIEIFSGKNKEVEIITYQKGPEEKEVTVKYNGKVIKKETVKMLSYEDQLDKLLDLKLKCHPLDDDGCWGIYASTQQKAVERFAKIKIAFPKAVTKRLKRNTEGDFGVDLYGQL